MTDLARQAGLAYSSDDSAAGNTLLAQAKSRILAIEDQIDKIVDRLEHQAIARRDISMRQAEFATKLAIAGGIRGARARIGIHRPHGSLDHRSAEAARSGHRFHHPWRTERRHAAGASVPEIAAMTKTLAMLRDSLIERDRLESERQRAETEARAARDTAEAACMI